MTSAQKTALTVVPLALISFGSVYVASDSLVGAFCGALVVFGLTFFAQRRHDAKAERRD